MSTGFRSVLPDEATGIGPPSAVAAIEQLGGGVWWAGDRYARPAEIVRRARDVGARALIVDARDLSWLTELPDLRFLGVRTDGRPILDPIADLPGLEGLMLEVRSVRTERDLLELHDLRWFRSTLGGRGGKALAARLPGGHERLEWLGLTEVPFRSIGEAVPTMPRLRHLRLHFADHLRAVGDLSPVAATLRGLELDITGLRRLDGIERADGIEAVSIAGQVDSLEPLARLASLRWLWIQSVEQDYAPFTGHAGLRAIGVGRIDAAVRAVLETLPRLEGVFCLPERIDPDVAIPWPNLADRSAAPELRAEWRRAIRG